jgi:hypothetical protein
MNNRKKISKQILNYLKKNPASADTLEGITDWWLKSERVDQAVDQVAEALEDLIEDGSIIKIKSQNGQILYRLAEQYS